MGTGGASSGRSTTGLLRLGEGDRNERSVIDAVLDCLTNTGPCWLPLPCEDIEALRTMRFVTVSPTAVGGIGCVRKAAAAAEEESDALDFWSFRKALDAAREAEALGGGFGACVERKC